MQLREIKFTGADAIKIISQVILVASAYFGLKQEVALTKAEITALKNEVANLKGDLKETAKTNGDSIGQVKTDVATIKADVRILESKLALK